MIDPQKFVLATVSELFFLPDKFIESSVLWLLLALLILGLALLVFYVISLPLRRQERDRFLLDVIESAPHKANKLNVTSSRWRKLATVRREFNFICLPRISKPVVHLLMRWRKLRAFSRRNCWQC